MPDVKESIYKSYIVFSERCTLKKIETHSSEVKVLQRQNLLNTIKKDMSESNNVLSKVETLEIYKKLSRFVLVDENVKKKHIEDIKSKM